MFATGQAVSMTKQLHLCLQFTWQLQSTQELYALDDVSLVATGFCISRC